MRNPPEYPQIERVVFWKDWEKAKNIVDVGIDLIGEDYAHKSTESAPRDRQAVRKLYEQIFSVALPKMAEKLDVVYTPQEVVDYILRSVDFVLQQEFGRRLTNKDVHIL